MTGGPAGPRVRIRDDAWDGPVGKGLNGRVGLVVKTGQLFGRPYFVLDLDGGPQGVFAREGVLVPASKVEVIEREAAGA